MKKNKKRNKMKNITKKIMCALGLVGFPIAVQAAGTYYTGTYQTPQTQYVQPNNYSNQPTFIRQQATYAPTDYTRKNYATPMTTNNRQVAQSTNSGATAQEGFFLNGYLGYESSMWQTSLNTAGSILSYNNVDWLTVNADMKYRFSMGDSLMDFDLGLTYGMQNGESSMIDDDITNGGYLVTTWVDGSNNIIGNQVGHAISIGTSDGGSMLGFHAGLGFTDAFQIGAMKVTPSIGVRYDNYTLQTSNNYGLSVDTAACFETQGGEVQCDPAIIVVYPNGSQAIIWRGDSADGLVPDSGWGSGLDTGGTYYFEQSGVSHAYDVTWMGPYIAMEGRYDINPDNYVTARMEIGLPSYSAIGDQPYRYDWAHPKSVEDTGDFGSALHFALGADYNAAISDSMMLTVGLTYDFYSVSGATANTYNNPEFFEGWFNNLVADWVGTGRPADTILTASVAEGTVEYTIQQTAQQIANLEAACPGWVCTAESEIESFFKSVGFKVGFKAKF